MNDAVLDSLSNDDLRGELELVDAMFGEEVVVAFNRAIPTTLNLVARFSACEVTLAISSDRFPTLKPSIEVTESPNATVSMALERHLSNFISSEQVLQPYLASILTEARQQAAEIVESVEAEREATRKAAGNWSPSNTADDETEDAEGLASSLYLTRLQNGTIWRGDPPILDRKSKFVAHVAKVSSEDDVREFVAVLRSVKVIATATHPAIYAYRFRTSPSSSALNYDLDDDGETGAGKKLLFVLEASKVEGYCVVVTRWFGGILLGPDRFKHIAAAARDALVAAGAVARGR